VFVSIIVIVFFVAMAARQKFNRLQIGANRTKIEKKREKFFVEKVFGLCYILGGLRDKRRSGKA